MKVLFVYTELGPEIGFSAGIDVLSAVLKQKGYQTSLIHISAELDYPLDLNRINKDIARIKPGLICFSATTNQWHFVRLIGRQIKKQFDKPIIVGGHHPTADLETVMEVHWIDTVCRGEGDEVLPKVVRRIEAGQSLDGISNILYRKNSKVVREPVLS